MTTYPYLTANAINPLHTLKNLRPGMWLRPMDYNPEDYTRVVIEIISLGETVVTYRRHEWTWRRLMNAQFADLYLRQKSFSDFIERHKHYVECSAPTWTHRTQAAMDQTW